MLKLRLPPTFPARVHLEMPIRSYCSILRQDRPVPAVYHIAQKGQRVKVVEVADPVLLGDADGRSDGRVAGAEDLGEVGARGPPSEVVGAELPFGLAAPEVAVVGESQHLSSSPLTRDDVLKVLRHHRIPKSGGEDETEDAARGVAEGRLRRAVDGVVEH